MEFAVKNTVVCFPLHRMGAGDTGCQKKNYVIKNCFYFEAPNRALKSQISQTIIVRCRICAKNAVVYFSLFRADAKIQNVENNRLLKY